MSKRKRQQTILNLVADQEIGTQLELVRALQAMGFVTVNQATVSRDIRDLRLEKVETENGTMRYVPPISLNDGDRRRLYTIFRESVLSILVAQNIVVIHTIPGLAPAAGSAIDGMQYDGLAGTLSGDDTVFLAMQDNPAAEDIATELRRMLE